MSFTITFYLVTVKKKPFSPSTSTNNNLTQIVINSYINIQKKIGINLHYFELSDSFSNMTAKVIRGKKDKLDFIKA